ncbi:MAG: 50S ribosomal protein L9 [Candidatus Peregrinibacteria bacterium]|nr:50S ribosomal protein L9 [Candidatus Peregrinibacteria bacterium]
MKVLLNKDVKKLGYRGDIVIVKTGYFTNFLLPEGLAIMADASVLKVQESRKAKLVIKKEQLVENAKEVIKKLKGLVVTISKKITSKGKLYGGLSVDEIVDAVLAKTNVKLEPSYIKSEPIKEVGEHDVLVHIAEGAEGTIKVIVEEKK